MDVLRIEGGSPLHGDIAISGAKNAALPLIAATLLAPGEHILRNVPDLRDTRTILRLLETMGATWGRRDGELRVDTTRLTGAEAPYELVKTMRASVLVLGPLLGRLGHARVSLPGGCAIGARPIDFHLSGFEQLGVGTHLTSGYVEARAEGRLRGGIVSFDTPSVTGTENVLMAAVLASGISEIRNAAREPEVGNLVDMLTSMGGRIEGKNSDLLVVRGVERLEPGKADIIPDRIETGTYLMAAGAAGGELRLTNCDPSHLLALTEKLHEVGLRISQTAHTITAACPVENGSPCPLSAVDLRTMPYPGFATDLQAQFMALMTMAEGSSLIHETIFENRFMHVAELRRLGADITVDGCSALVRGIGSRDRLTGAPVMATDLRASASLVIAGLAAQGTTEISRIYHLERGYENLVEKLRGVGARISRSAQD